MTWSRELSSVPDIRNRIEAMIAAGAISRSWSSHPPNTITWTLHWRRRRVIETSWHLDEARAVNSSGIDPLRSGDSSVKSNSYYRLNECQLGGYLPGFHRDVTSSTFPRPENAHNDKSGMVGCFTGWHLRFTGKTTSLKHEVLRTIRLYIPPQVCFPEFSRFSHLRSLNHPPAADGNTCVEVFHSSQFRVWLKWNRCKWFQPGKAAFG